MERRWFGGDVVTSMWGFELNMNLKETEARGDEGFG